MSLTDTSALTTVATMEAELGLVTAAATTTVLERLIRAASAAIEQYCDRSFRKGSRTQTLPGSGTQRLVLPHPPIVSVTSVTDDGALLAAADYSVEDAEAGILLNESLWTSRDLAYGIAQDAVPGTGKRNLSVVYVSGYVLPGDTVGTRNLPYDIEEAAIITVASLWRARGSDRRVQSESVGDASASYGGVNTAIGRGAGGIIPDEAAVILAPYRRTF